MVAREYDYMPPYEAPAPAFGFAMPTDEGIADAVSRLQAMQARDSGRDVCILTPRNETVEQEEIRQAVENEIQYLLASVEKEIGCLEAENHEGASDTQIEELKSLRSFLQDQAASARCGSMAAVYGIMNVMGTTASVALGTTSSALSGSALQMGINFASMSQEMVETIRALNTAQAIAFRQYEATSHERIMQLGAPEVYAETRDELLARREEARANNDRVGEFRADGLLAFNNVLGLQAAGADPDEIERAQREYEAARERFREEAAAKAREQGIADGLSGEALEAHIAGEVRAQTDAFDLQAAQIESRYAAEAMGMSREEAIDLQTQRSDEVQAAQQLIHMQVDGASAEEIEAQRARVEQERREYVIAVARGIGFNENAETTEAWIDAQMGLGAARDAAAVVAEMPNATDAEREAAQAAVEAAQTAAYAATTAAATESGVDAQQASEIAAQTTPGGGVPAAMDFSAALAGRGDREDDSIAISSDVPAEIGQITEEPYVPPLATPVVSNAMMQYFRS